MAALAQILPQSPKLMRRLVSDQTGAGILELALVLPVLLVLLVGAIDLSLFISAKLDLEQAAQRTTDLALSQRPLTSDGTYLKTEAATASGESAENITVSIYLECGGVREATFNTICPGGQSQARYVDVSIRNEIEPLFDWANFARAFGFGSGSASGSITVVGDSVVRFQ